MARIAGVDLPRDKRVEIGLTYIFGIGRTTSNKILKEAGINPFDFGPFGFIFMAIVFFFASYGIVWIEKNFSIQAIF